MDTLDYFAETPLLNDGTLILSFSGWMDGGDASTGTVDRLIRAAERRTVCRDRPGPVYIFNFPGPMESLRSSGPRSTSKRIVQSVEMPRNEFFAAEEQNLILFKGRRRISTGGGLASAFQVAHQDCGVKRLLFVGSFGGSVPHARDRGCS